MAHPQAEFGSSHMAQRGDVLTSNLKFRVQQFL